MYLYFYRQNSIDKVFWMLLPSTFLTHNFFNFFWFLLNAIAEHHFPFSVIFLIIDVGYSFNIIGINKQMLYEYVGNVLVGSKPQDEGRPSPPTTGWIVRGKLTLQRQSELIMAAAVSNKIGNFLNYYMWRNTDII